MDGDLQHKPIDIKKFLNVFLKDKVMRYCCWILISCLKNNLNII